MEEELPMDSDSSDEDYIPAGAENNASEEESGNESANPDNDDCTGVSKKRKKTANSRKKKKVRCNESEDEEKEEEKENNKLVTEEDTKKKADSLWADFMKDCGPTVKKGQPSKMEIEEIDQPETKPIKQLLAKKEQTKITEILTFAGEEVQIEKPVIPQSTEGLSGPSKRCVRGTTSGLGSILSMMGKKGKLSTLEKSKLDWDRFKSSEGISEDLERHNKGRSGYLEKQDFLQRTDLRQFEIEKSMRSATRRTSNR